MTPSSFAWLRRGALLWSLCGLWACTSNPATNPTCTPECRAGYTCVSGACVQACNPVCAANESCVVQSGAATCVPQSAGDAATGNDGNELATPTDSSVSPDATAMDSAPPTDAVTPPADAVVLPDSAPPTDGSVAMDASPADSGRPACGMASQPCCNGYACGGNNSCNGATMRCEALTPEADECTATGTCASGQVCGFGSFCSGGTRPCLRCMAPVAGGLAVGAACGGSVTTPCASSLCGSGACRSACSLDSAGNAACRAMDPQGVCSEFSTTARLADGGLGPTATFGACVHSCAREGDCATGQSCALSGQSISDDYVRYCHAPVGTIAVGASCPLVPTSNTDLSQYCLTGQGWQCVPASTSSTETRGYCSAFCGTDADCPSTLPHCTDTSFYRPSGMGITGPLRMCGR